MLRMSAMRASLEHDFILDDHVANHPVANFRKLLDAIAKSIVRHDTRVQLAGE